MRWCGLYGYLPHFLDELSTGFDPNGSSFKTDRNIDLDRMILHKPEEINVQDPFIYRMKLHVFHKAFMQCSIQVYLHDFKFRWIDQAAKLQGHKCKVLDLITTVQYTGYKVLFTDCFGGCLAKVGPGLGF